MSRPAHAHPTRRQRAGSTAPRWISALAISLTIASVPAVAPPLAPRDMRVVNATQVALAALPAGLSSATAAPGVQPVNDVVTQPISTLFDPQVNPVLSRISDAIYPRLIAAFQDPQQQEVIGDFFQGGIAGVLKKQATSRLTSPDQTQILNDFFQGGVFQSEAHRFLQLFQDPQQHQFISDFVTGGLVQVLRNRLLDATSDPAQQAAIIAFFPDEVTDYRGGPIAVVQRRLIAAAKGNPGVIGLVNDIFENPVVVAVQHLLGGGPLVGTPLHELPPITPAAAVAPPHTAPVESPVSEVATPTVVATLATVTSSAKSAVPAAIPAKATPETTATSATATAAAEPEVSKDPEGADVIKTGNKVEPTGTGGPKHAKPVEHGSAIFGQVAEAITKGLTGKDTAPTAPAAGGGDDAASGADAG